jgi:alpha-L-rhamnosidase
MSRAAPKILVTALLLSARAAAADQPAGSPLRPTNLRCEYLVEPLAVDVAKPRLSWELEAADPSARGLRQSAYRVVVLSSSPEQENGGILWDSGKIASDRTCQVEYGGPKLTPGSHVAWNVRVFDQDGKEARSAQAAWRTGRPMPEAWEPARWIGDATATPEGTAPLPAPMLRKSFAAAGKGEHPFSATLYVTALGLYEVSINGERVGDRELAPEWTDYRKRVQYQAYDVTNLVRQKETGASNCIGVVLGDGWYAGKIGLSQIVPKGPTRAIYGRTPAVLVRLDIEEWDGSVKTVVSDGTWRSTLAGPIRSDDLLDGETYDARAAIAGWNRPGFDDSSWTAAKVVETPKIAVVAQANEPVRVTREVKAVALTEPKPGVYVYDLGQNMVGHCRWTFAAAPGATIALRHAEVLNPDGTIYTTNLRGAAQTDRYTFATDKPETYEPRFTYHGFRYVEVTGLRSKPALDALVGRVTNSGATETSTFECSDPMVNRLWQNILWTQRGNLVGVPTDCPQRDERCGWMGDILAFAPTACFNMDMAAFLTKWVPDTRDAQAKDGRFADFSPQPYDPDVRFSGVPAWGDAGVFVPWAAYQYYGDTRILADQFDAAVRWVEYIHAKNPDLLWKNSRGNDYGDWLNADTLKLEGWPKKGAEVPKDVFATMYFFRSTQIVAEMARVLGREAEAKKYGELAGKIRAAFVNAYVTQDFGAGADEKTPILEGDTQAGYALALHFGLIPEALQGAATRRMVECFKPYDGQISTGFHSTLPLMMELSLRGHNDEAYRLLLNRKMPSWGYEIDHGGTTIWERWDGYVEGRGFQDPGMNSFAHYAIGSVGEWMFATMLGIRADEPGFGKVTIAPHPGPGIEWAKGSYHSIRGTIAVAWDQRGGTLKVSATIPPNVSARVVLPARDPVKVTLDGKALSTSKDATLEPDRDSVVCRVGSGTYEFFIQP